MKDNFHFYFFSFPQLITYFNINKGIGKTMTLNAQAGGNGLMDKKTMQSRPDL